MDADAGVTLARMTQRTTASGSAALLDPQKLRDARLENGWSMDTLAARSGVSQPTISNWEAGRIKRPLPGHLKAVAVALGLRVRDLRPERTAA